MKRTKLTITVISLALLLSILFNLTGCVTVQAANLMDGVTANKVNKLDDLEEQSASFTDFALRLFKATNEDGENVLISPLSVMCALSMTLNGAEGNTLTQMEDVLGMQRDELNLYLYSYITSLPKGEKYKLIQANSIWFRDDDRFSVSPDFLQTNADYYGADIYKAPFDRQTLKDINNWVKLNTDGMIPKILDDIPDNAIMYLVNALAFEAEWKEVYKKTQVRDGKFTTEDGEVQNVKLMYAEENRYLEDENATGFIKYYSDKKYAFAAILPNEGVSVSEYLASIDGEALYSMLTNSQSTTVKTAIPKFEVEYDTEMSGILKEMGMSDAFNSILADFSGIGSSTRGNIYIGRVIHKTFIEVGEKGTRAGAATVVETNDAAAPPSKPKEVILDRPFIYMLIDCENNVPFFIGTLMDAD